jgi:AcrR family transcriptional regulator
MPRPLPPEVVASAGGSEAPAVRDHILDAAHRVIATQGLAAASTRAVAAEAGIATGTVYNYFDNRLALLAQAISRRIRLQARPIDDLVAEAGKATVAANLRKVARQAAEVLDEMVPLFAAAFSDTELLHALHHEVAAGGLAVDPAAPIERYLVAEQGLGRVAADADCRAAASTVISLCHDRAFHRYFTGAAHVPASIDREIALVVRAVTPG